MREGTGQESLIVIHDNYVICLYVCMYGHATHANEPIPACGMICETKQRWKKCFISYPTTKWKAKDVINLGLSEPTEQFRRLLTPM